MGSYGSGGRGTSSTIGAQPNWLLDSCSCAHLVRWLPRGGVRPCEGAGDDVTNGVGVTSRPSTIVGTNEASLVR